MRGIVGRCSGIEGEGPDTSIERTQISLCDARAQFAEEPLDLEA